MIATFHQLNAYVQIAQIPGSPSKRLSRRLVLILIHSYVSAVLERWPYLIVLVMRLF